MKLCLWISSAFGVLTLFALVINTLGHDDSHRTNFRYLAWKRGSAPQDYRWCLHLYFVDHDFQDQMKGKTMAQLRQWLPETGPSKPGTWQADWLTTKPKPPGTSFEQIGISNIAIELKDGKFDTIFPMKG